MEPDLHISGNILFSDNYALKTTDGVATVTIAGSASSSGNLVAIGLLARFGNITGFRQISPTHVVVVDNTNHCLRLVDRLTLQTPWYAGYCGRSGNSDRTTNARFNGSRSVIVDQNRPDMLLVSDTNNKKIRHVQVAVGSGICTVSTFVEAYYYNKRSFVDSWLDSMWNSMRIDLYFQPTGITQEPIYGDLYITTTTRQVYRLSYNSKSLGFIFESEYGDYLLTDAESILTNNSTKLVLADHSKNQLMALDLATRRTTQLCSGLRAHIDGDMAFCKLDRPTSLMAINNTLYVGEYQKIRKIQGNW